MEWTSLSHDELRDLTATANNAAVRRLWTVLCSRLSATARKYEVDLHSKSTTTEDLRYSQGVLYGLNCAIIVLDRFLKYASSVEDERREVVNGRAQR